MADYSMNWGGYVAPRMGLNPNVNNALQGSLSSWSTLPEVLMATPYAAPDYGLGAGYGGGQGLQAPASAMAFNANPVATPQGKDWSWMGNRDQQGVAGLALGGAQFLGSMYLGMQQYNLAKETLANNKANFERQYAANKTLTNSSLEDRQRARVASNSGAYQSVGDYMKQNGVV